MRRLLLTCLLLALPTSAWASFCDVVQTPSGFVLVDLAGGRVQATPIPAGTRLWAAPAPIQLFLRADASPDGRIAVTGVDADNVAHVLIDGGAPVRLGKTWGQDTTVVFWDRTVGAFTVVTAHLNTELVAYAPDGAIRWRRPAALGSQGIRDVLPDGTVQIADAHYRATLTDGRVVTRPNTSGGVLVGQWPDTGMAVQVGTRIWTAFPGLFTYEPHVAGDTAGLAVCSRTNAGTRAAVYRPPFPAHEPATPAPRPTPTPTPAPPPPTPPPAPTNPTLPLSDAIDLSTVTFLHANVRDWRITSDLYDVRLPTGDGVGLELRHSQAGQWPVARIDGTETEGNPWIFARIGGRWYAATYEWLRPGQTVKLISRTNLGDHTKQPPLQAWDPQPGEQVGFMVSCLARTAARNCQERTQVVLTHWPGGPPAPSPPPPTPEPPPCPTCPTFDAERAALQATIHALEADRDAAQAAHAAIAEELARLRAQPPPRCEAKLFGAIPIPCRIIP